MEEQVQMNEKLRALLEKAKREKKIASKDLIDTLEAIDADEKQTELIYEALDEAGVEIDVSDVVELLSKPEEMLPSEEDLELIEEEKIIDTEDLSENMSLNDPVRMYLKEIGKIPLLTLEEEHKLAVRMAEGDEEAQKKMTEANLRLVVSIAKRYVGRGLPFLDLIQEGNLGLIKAVGTFKSDRNIKLATYASRCIENEILMHIRKIAGQKAEVSLDEPINTDWDGNELLLSDVLGTDGDIVMRPMEEDAEQQLLREALARLPERERRIVSLRFGLGGRPEKTQKEVADLLGISQSYISRLEKRIMQRLRRDLLRQVS